MYSIVFILIMIIPNMYYLYSAHNIFMFYSVIALVGNEFFFCHGQITWLSFDGEDLRIDLSEFCLGHLKIIR